MTRHTHPSIEPDNALVEQAIARVLESERAAATAISEAKREAAAIEERARIAARTIADRTERRIACIRARFEARIAAEVAAFDDAAAALPTHYELTDADSTRLNEAVAALAGELTGTRA